MIVLFPTKFQQITQDGKITCRYDIHCTDDELHQNQKFITHDSIEVSNLINKSSKATATEKRPTELLSTATALSTPTTTTSTNQQRTTESNHSKQKSKREIKRKIGN
jgi:hypothetical protein